MKSNKKVMCLSLICLSVMLAYFFLSFITLDTEIQLTPEWTADITKAQEKPETNEKLLPFRFERHIGYFTPSGKITLLKDIQYKATFSKDFFALYSSNAENIKVFDSLGKEHCTIDGAGFPFIQQDRIFLMLPGGSSFAFVNEDDGKLFSVFENTSPIISFNSSRNGVAAGFANGDFLIFGNDGKLKITLNPSGSDFPVILGSTISNNGNMFACISGIEPQRLMLYKNEDTYQKIIFHKNLKENLTRQIYIHFSNNDEFAYYDSSDSLTIVDIEKLESSTIPIKGMILDIQETFVANTVFVFSRENKNYTVTILENFKEPSGEFTFNAESAFILVEDNSLFVGRDGKISRITISKE